MSLESQDSTMQNALENEQRFVLDTKEGLQTFHEFLVSEEGQIDALDPNLTIEDLALPENVAVSLKQLRLEYKELVRLTKEGLQTETDEFPENVVDSIVNQYQAYIDADGEFSDVYVAYEATLENQPLNKNDTDMVEEKSSQSAPGDAESVSEHKPTPLEESPKTQGAEGVSEKVVSLQKEISEQYEGIKKTHDTIGQRFSREKRSPEIENVLDTLNDLHTRASVVQHKATKKDELNPEPSVDDLKNYVRSIERIRTRVDSLVSSLGDEQVQYVAPEESDAFVVEQQTDDERAPLKVFGMSLPHAGLDGALIARSFRDRLEIVKRKHPDIKDNPEKLAIADSIIRLLYVVPADGLTEEQVTEVAKLARALNAFEKEVVASERATGKAEHATPGSEEVESDSEASDTAPDEYISDRKRFTSKKMHIEADSSSEENIKISVADKAEEEIDKSSDSVVGAIEQLTHSTPGSSVIAEMEKQDSVNSINNSIPKRVARDSKKREAVRADSLTRQYLMSNPQYQTFFQENNISPATFEKKSQDTIKRIDAREIDFWEAKFDEPYKSAFSYLQKMTLQEIAELNALPPGERKNLLREENVKYEAYLTWMDTYELIAQTITLEPAMKFDEIFVKWMAETELTYYNEDIHAE
jgi:hypothetical protein